MAEKTVTRDAQGHTTRIRRRWDTAQTPFQRLAATAALALDQRERLQTLYEQTNPLALRQRIYDQLAVLRGLAERAAPTEEGTPAGVPSSAPTTAA